MTSNRFKTISSRWSALQTRDPAAASSFIYSVISTRIYCRPNCPSRLARRANIIFHDAAAEAEAAGFRPCKRCRPELGIENIEAGMSLLMVEKAKSLIGREGKPGEKEKWSVKELAEEVGLTESHFCRTFKKRVGLTVGSYRSLIQYQSTMETTATSPPRELKRGGLSFPSASSDHQVSYEDQSTRFCVLVEQPALRLSQDWNLCSNSAMPDSLSFEKEIEFQFGASNFLEVLASQDNDDCFQFVNLDYQAN